MEALAILQDLIKCKSITPNDDGAIQYCSDFLNNLGFETKVLNFYNVKNLYAKLGNFDKNLCFAGHVDVVPPLDVWTSNPFEINIRDNKAYGRGTNDMKGPLSACLAAIFECVNNKSIPKGISLSVMLTSDEEQMGEYGTKRIVKHLQEHNEKIDLCILCESCSAFGAAEYIKTGCRGSLNVTLTSTGKQCHVATATTVGNHMHNFVKILDKLCNTPLDSGNETFENSSLQLTSIESSQNKTRNIVPHFAQALINVRFNNNWTFDGLERYITCKSQGVQVEFERFGDPFIGCSDKIAQKLQLIIQNITGKNPQIGAKGGNSDALFIKEIANVVEIGSPLSEAHIVDEYIKLDDLKTLKKVYAGIIKNFENK